MKLFDTMHHALFRLPDAQAEMGMGEYKIEPYHTFTQGAFYVIALYSLNGHFLGYF